MSALSLVTALILLGADPVSSPPDDARVVIEKAIKAHGGADKLVSAKALYTRYQVKYAAGTPRNATIEGESWEKGNGTQITIIRLKSPTREVAVVTGTRDGKGWMTVDGKVKDLSPAEHTEVLLAVYADGMQALVPLLTDKRFALTALGQSKVDEVPVVGVKVVKKGEADVCLYFEEKTGLLKKIEHNSKNLRDGDKEVPRALVLDDYRSLDTRESDRKVLKAANVGSDGPALLTYLRAQICGEAERKAMKELLKQLADESFEIREKASMQLSARGPLAVPFLREALKDDDSEVAKRANKCLEKIGSAASPEGAFGAALRLVGDRKPAGAAEVLLALAPSVTDSALKNELYWALEAVAVRDGKPDKIVEQALSDKDPARRAAAASALGKDGGFLAKQAGRRLAIEGFKRPWKVTEYLDAAKIAEYQYTDIQIVNKFDEAIFAPPK